MDRFNRFLVRGKDQQGDWCIGYLTPVGDGTFVIKNTSGEYLVDKNTLCRSTGFKTYIASKKLFRIDTIFEKDIVKVTSHGGTEWLFLIWHCLEMNCLEAVPLDNNDTYFNGWDYHSDSGYSWEDFCFLVNDPWGDIDKVEVIGNCFDNTELLSEVKMYV